MWVISEKAPSRPNTDAFKLWNVLLWVSVGVLAQFVIAVIAVDIHQVRSWCSSPTGCSFAVVCRAIPFFSSIFIVFPLSCCICRDGLSCFTRLTPRGRPSCCTRLTLRDRPSCCTTINEGFLKCCTEFLPEDCRSCCNRFITFCGSIHIHLQNINLLKAKPQSFLVFFPLNVVSPYILICHFLAYCFSSRYSECSKSSKCSKCLMSCPKMLLSVILLPTLFILIVIVLFYLLPVILLLVVYPVKVGATYSFLIAALVLYILIAFYSEYKLESSYREPDLILRGLYRLFYLLIPQLNILFILAIAYLFVAVYIAILSGGPQVSVVHAILSQLPTFILSAAGWIFKKWFLKKEPSSHEENTYTSISILMGPGTSEPSSHEESTSTLIMLEDVHIDPGTPEPSSDEDSTSTSISLQDLCCCCPEITTTEEESILLQMEPGYGAVDDTERKDR